MKDGLLGDVQLLEASVIGESMAAMMDVVTNAF